MTDVPGAEALILAGIIGFLLGIVFLMILISLSGGLGKGEK